MGLNHSPKIVTNGLIFCLDAKNIKSYPGSGATWLNAAGRADMLATLTGSPTYNTNGYFSFNGTTQYAKRLIPTVTFGNSSNISYNVWFRQTSTSAGGIVRPISLTSVIASYTLMQLSVESNSLTFSTSKNLGAGFDFTTGYAIPFNGTWVNASISHTFGGPVYIYVNGSLIYTTTNNTSIATGPYSYYEIGQNETTFDFFGGDIAYVSYYDIALTTAEVQQNFNAIRGRFGI
jgi:hypothetical protein